MTADLPKTLFTVQALRSLAAGAVLVYHVLFMMTHSGGYSFVFSDIGSTGVDLFFVISGFIMVYTTYSSFGKPNATASFIRRRVIRVFPIYWFYTTVIVVILLVLSPRFWVETKSNWEHVVFSYLCILSKNYDGNVGTIMQTGWTLCYEVYFYLVFAILLNTPRKYFLFLSGSVFLFGIFMGLGREFPPWATVATNPILLEFYFGAIIAFLFVNGFLFRHRLAYSSIIIGIAVMVTFKEENVYDWKRVFAFGLPYSLLLLGVVSLERAGMKAFKLLVVLGDSSYTLYLVHPIVVQAIGKIWAILKLSETLPPTILFLGAFSCSLVLAHLLYHLIEKPVTRWLLHNC